MRGRFRVLALTFLWAAVAETAAEAAPPVHTDCGFSDAAEVERTNRQRIGATRGAVSPINVERLNAERARDMRGNATVADVSNWLSARVKSGVYAQGTYVLFYSQRAARPPERQPGLHTWLIGPEGLVACTVQRVSPRGLADDVWALMGSLQITERQIPRSARRRRATPTPVRPVLATGEGAASDDAIAAISRIVFSPELVPHLRRAQHLVIVPTGEIGTLPFYALHPFGDATQVVDHFSVTIAPSLPSLALPAEPWRATAAFAKPLIVGDPHLPPSEAWQVPALAGARAEARDLARQLNGQAIVGQQATKRMVVAAAPGASLLYIATHGIADDLDPVNGGFLMLSAEPLEDGFWTAREIQSSRMRAHLAVLSACQTGLGAAHEGGTIGLTRAFQLAGVPRVIMSLWNVDDNATRFLMGRFMSYVHRHHPAEALRRAMLDTRRKHAHPALWASFLSFGEAS